MSAIRFYAEAQLGAKRRLTPEGFLICQDVPVARVGTLLYGAGEVPVDASPDGIVSIERLPEDVFDDDAIRSFEGKPVTNNHPPLGMKVEPSNWRQLAIGHVQNVRRGDGVLYDNDYLYADLMLTDPDAIRDVNEGKREVSAGYDAEYEQLAPGRGRQHDIIGNHVALVDRGRCGPRCAIGDQETMPATKRVSVIDRLRAAFYARDEAGMTTAVQELQKVPGMEGDIVSDEMTMPAGVATPGGGHTINLNLHNMGGKPPGADSTAQDTRGRGRDDGEAGEVPGQAGGGAEGGASDVMAMLQQLSQRMENVEQAVILLAQEEGDEDDEGEGGEEQPGATGDDENEMGAGNQPRWKQGEPGSVEEGGGRDGARRMAGDRGRRAAVGDSTSLGPLFQETLARAAILAPTFLDDVGRRAPTYDAARGARQTMDDLCVVRRLALAHAWSTDAESQAVIKNLHVGRPNFTKDAMTCQAATMLFNAASEVRRAGNTQDGRTAAGRTAAVRDGLEVGFTAGRAPTPAELNKRYSAFYKQQA